MSGLTPDARTMIERARTEALVYTYLHCVGFSMSDNLQNYWFTYNEPMKVESVTKAVCNLAMQFGEGEDAEEGALVCITTTCSIVLS